MSDPVLDAHEVEQLQYVISGPQPISIRDQMLRGTTIVERLIRRQIIDRGTRELVVSGAGAAGACVAMAASRHGVKTTLVEIGVAAFRTQSFSGSRLIDPTQYDWPLDHFLAQRLPWDLRHAPFPLPFGAARAVLLSLRWRSELKAHAASYPLTWVPGHKVTSVTVVQIPATLDPIECLKVSLDNGTTIQAGAYVDAKGFGSERCTFPQNSPFDYEGFPFWGHDTFDRLDPSRHQVLISGSGDGALQDYLRVITHLASASHIIRECNIPVSVMHAVQSAEDRSHRGRSWSSEDPPHRGAEEGPYFEELNAMHRQEVARALSYPQVRAGLARLVPKPIVPTHVVYRDSYISAYYGLNRFLTLLLSVYIEQRDSFQSLYPNASINSIARDPSLHDCIDRSTGRAKGTYDATNTMLLVHECFENDHTVTFSGSGPATAKYNVIIVRHGLEQAPKLNLTRTRHLLPYHHVV